MEPFEDLKQQFPTKLRDSLDGWYAQYREEFGMTDLNFFLSFLLQKELVDPTVLEQLSGYAAVDLTNTNTLVTPNESSKPNATAPLYKAVQDNNTTAHDPNPPQAGQDNNTTAHDPQPYDEPSFEAPKTDPQDLLRTAASPRKKSPRQELMSDTGPITFNEKGPAYAPTYDAISPIQLPSSDQSDAIGIGPRKASKESLKSTMPFGVTVPNVQASEIEARIAARQQEADAAASNAPAQPPTGQLQNKAQAPARPTPAQPDADEGEYVGSTKKQYVLLEQIGEGGMGVVYLARNRFLGRRVAFKQLRKDVAKDPELTGRFLREAQITAQLDHPGIVPVYALVDGEQGLPAYTMKVIQGKTLKELLQEAKDCYQAGQIPPEDLSLRALLDIFLPVCDAISYAHSKGVLHRDLKPDNILVGRFGEVYVVDWGLARLMFSLEGLEEDDVIEVPAHDPLGPQIETHVGQLLGTPRYMSPEQTQGLKNIDGRSDLYSLGLILFELVFLKHGRVGDNVVEMIGKALRNEIADMVHIAGVEIPEGIKAIIRKATALAERERYQSVQAMGDALRHFLRRESQQTLSSTPSISPFSTSEASVSKRQSGSFLRVLLFLVLIAGLGTSGFFLWKSQKAQRQLQREARQERLTATRLRTVIHHTQRIDRYFHHIEQSLNRLHASARVLLFTKPPRKAKYFLNSAFNPPDLGWSPFYHDQTSFRWPVIKLAPTLASNKSMKLKKHLASLSLLASHQREALFQSLTLLDKDKQHKNPRNKGFPLLSSFVATREGVISLYPGRGSYPPQYDPRKRPWFQNTQKKPTGPHWSALYVSSQKIHAAAIACISPLRDPQGKFFAVVGVDLRLNSLADFLESLTKTIPWAEESFLLDRNGHILVRSSRRLRRFGDKKTWSKVLKNPIHPEKKLIEALRLKRPHGFIHIPSTEGNRLFVFSRLQSQRWFLLVTAKP